MKKEIDNAMQVLELLHIADKETRQEALFLLVEMLERRRILDGLRKEA